MPRSPPDSDLPANAGAAFDAAAAAGPAAADAAAGDIHTAGATQLAALNPSLLHDLQRFEQIHPPGHGLDVLEVLAAALRHSRALLLQLQLDYRVIPLLVRPLERQIASPLTLPQWMGLRLSDLRVLRVEPAPVPAAAGPLQVPAAPGLVQVAALAPLLWELALRGAREALLPEIGGVAAYRVVPSANLAALDLSGSLAAAVLRLRETATPLREIAGWPGFDGSRAARMLNGLYLQAALMITRTHPSAIDGGGGSSSNV